MNITGYCEYGDRATLEKILAKCRAANIPLEEYLATFPWKEVDEGVPEQYVGIWGNGYLCVFETEDWFKGKKMSPEEFLAQIKTPRDLILEELKFLSRNEPIDRMKTHVEIGYFKAIHDAEFIINKHLPI